MYLRLFHTLCALLIIVTMMGCDDNILTDVTAQPSYDLNADDSFDMGVLLTGRTTSTQKLMLYNRNRGTIELESLALRGGDSSLFRINVDGMAGVSFTNSDLLQIARGDSLYILLEASFHGTQSQRDVLREDFIDIRCNGRTSSIRLTVTTRDVEELRADTIRCDTLWAEGGLDKLLYDALVIPSGVTLSVGPGVNIYLHDHASIEVYGALRLEGTAEQPVMLLGDRTDKLFDNLYYRDMSAQWGGIHLHPGSSGSLFDHAEIRGMTSGIRVEQEATDLRVLDGLPDFMADDYQQLIIRNSLIMNSDSSLITATASNMIIENTCLMNSAGALLELQGGAYDVTHCTLANYNFWALFSKPDVVLRNYAMLPAAEASSADQASLVPLPRPLHRCNITNSIIYGNSGYDPNISASAYGSGSRMPDFLYFVDDQGLPLDSIYRYRIDHCLVHSTTGYDDDDCIQVLWDADPQYLIVDPANYTFDPHLLPESPCIGVGDPRTLERLPLDREGRQRHPQPALGCYEL